MWGLYWTGDGAKTRLNIHNWALLVLKYSKIEKHFFVEIFFYQNIICRLFLFHVYEQKSNKFLITKNCLDRKIFTEKYKKDDITFMLNKLLSNQNESEIRFKIFQVKTPQSFYDTWKDDKLLIQISN